MRKIILSLMLSLACGFANATPIVLYDNTNRELGTSTNPLKVSFSGDQTISGDLSVGGNITASGTVSAAGMVTTGLDERIYGTYEYIDFNDIGAYKMVTGSTSVTTQGRLAFDFSGATTIDPVIYSVDTASVTINDGMNIYGSGYSGLGTRNPSALLDVAGCTRTNVDGVNDICVADSVEVDSKLYVDGGLYINTASGTGWVQIGTSNAADSSYLTMSGNRFIIKRDGVNNNSRIITSGSLFFNTGFSAIETVSPTPNLYLENGFPYNVGIGTNSATAKLVISDVAAGPTKNFISGRGDLIVVNDIEADGNIYAGTGTTVFTAAGTGGIYAGGGIESDLSVYHGAVNNYYKSPDGTCSMCYPNNSDTWVCESKTCPTGM